MAIDFNDYLENVSTPQEYLDAVLDYYLDILSESLLSEEDSDV